MRCKTSDTLVTFPKDREIVVYNYLSKATITCAQPDLYWLYAAPDWTEVDDLISAHPHIDPDSVRTVIDQLIDAGVLLAEHSPGSQQEIQYQQSWELGLAAGLFHFSAWDNDFVSLSESVNIQKERSLTNPSPELYSRNNEGAIQLPECKGNRSNQLLQIMERRRTQRNVLSDSLTIDQLSECLYAGLGITGFVKTETATLPLKMTPSGGARNPFEAFVWVRNVQDLKPGIYHYSAVEHSLASIAPLPVTSAADLLKGQEWANDMPAIIFLVAMLPRTTWKYKDPNAYRVIMIEAGHIAQNMMLACTHNRLTACPTAALAHSQISEILNLKGIAETPVYAIAVGRPAESTDVILPRSYMSEAAHSEH